MRVLPDAAQNCTGQPRNQKDPVDLLLRKLVVGAAMLLWPVTAVLAQTTVILPDSTQTTPVSAYVPEQLRVTVPAGVSFNVTNIGTATAANVVTVAIDQIIVTTATKQIRLALRAVTASFTPPESGAATWTASDVSWNAASWTAATGAGGTLSSAVFTPVATCAAGATACSTTTLMFSLAANPAVQRSGTHRLVVTWKLESIGS
jgi:hypothetical protein